MSKRVFRNWMAFFFVILVLAALLVVSGCTRYNVVKGAQGSPEYTEISVWSNRDFEQPELHLTKTPEQVQFDFGAASATGQPSPFEAIGAMAVQELLNRMLPPTPAAQEE